MPKDETIGVVSRNESTEIRVTVSEFKGKKYVGIREYSNWSTTPLEEKKPTKKGINIPVDLWPEVKELLDQVETEEA